MRILAIGDIHGHLTALEALLLAVRPTPADWLIFLGDYVELADTPADWTAAGCRLRARGAAVRRAQPGPVAGRRRWRKRS